MKKRLAAIVSLTLCAAMGICACSAEEETDPFTGEVTEDLPYQANLNLISPSAYSSVEGLELEPGTYISVIGKEESSSYWTQIRAGVQQAAEDLNQMLGYSGDDSIRVLFNAPSGTEDIDEQVNILDEELARYPDVIAIASIDENASQVQFDLAAGNGIPIVAFDSGNVYQGIQCICTTDNREAGAEGADRLCQAAGESGEVALIVHDSVSGNAKDRTEGFLEEIRANHPDVTVAEIIYMDQLDSLKEAAAAAELGITTEQLEEAKTAAAAGTGETGETESGAQGTTGSSGTGTESDAQGTTGSVDTEGTESGIQGTNENGETVIYSVDEIVERAAAAVQEMSDQAAVSYILSQYPDLKGCFGTNGDAVELAISAVESVESVESGEGTGTVLIMGFDAGSEQIEDLEQGRIHGLIQQNPFGMGYAVVIAAARTVLESGNEAVVDTGYVWVDAENLEDETVQALLYE